MLHDQTHIELRDGDITNASNGISDTILNSDKVTNLKGNSKPTVITQVENECQRTTRLLCWSTGLFYNVKRLCFITESLSENKEDYVSITCSSTIEGRRIFGRLVDTVEQLITEWYPGLAGVVEQKALCCECLRTNVSIPFEFRVDQLLPLVADHKLTTECGLSHKVQLIDLVPDMLLADLDPLFRLDPNEAIYPKKKKTY